jgi:hypothetical protein
MSAWRSRRLDRAANQVFQREKLRRRRDAVLRAGEQKEGLVERARIDAPAERPEAPRGEEIIAIKYCTTSR